MKKLFLFSTLLSVMSFSSFSQDCQWKEKKKDSFTNSTYLKTLNLSKVVMGERPAPDVSTYFSAFLESKDRNVSLSVIYSSTQMLSLKKIEKPVLLVKQADGNTITLKSENDFDLTVQKKEPQTRAVLSWTIGKEDLKKLSASGINAMRLSFGGVDYTYLLKEISTKEFLQMFGCMNTEVSGK